MKEYMSAEAVAYYKGGTRKMIGGVPCRVANHGTTKGLAFIKQCVAGQVEIDGDNRPDECSRFRFVPAAVHHPDGWAREENCKPSARGNYAYSSRVKVTSGWRPASISLAPYGCHSRYGGLTATPDKLNRAIRKWRDDGNPEPLREYLADTAAERRAYWAAYDAAREADAAANWRIAA